MPESFQALLVIVVALLPGALYTWSFEQVVGAWGAGLSDRVLRFIGVTAILQALAAPAIVWSWRTFILSGRLREGDLPIGLWLLPLLYVAVPIALGTLVGTATLEKRSWAKLFTGRSPAPRAWDHLFGSRPDGWIRLKLKSGEVRWRLHDRRRRPRSVRRRLPGRARPVPGRGIRCRSGHGSVRTGLERGRRADGVRYLGQVVRGGVPRLHRCVR